MTLKSRSVCIQLWFSFYYLLFLLVPTCGDKNIMFLVGNFLHFPFSYSKLIFIPECIKSNDKVWQCLVSRIFRALVLMLWIAIVVVCGQSRKTGGERVVDQMSKTICVFSPVDTQLFSRGICATRGIYPGAPFCPVTHYTSNFYKFCHLSGSKGVGEFVRSKFSNVVYNR